MRKKLSLILVLLLAAILAVTLFACSKKAQTVTPPDVIDPSTEGGEGLESQASRVALNFRMPYANSVFNGIYIDEFDISKITYSFVYYAEDGSELSSKEMGALSEDMVVPEDRPLLLKAGNHYINVVAKLDSGEDVTGKFQLRLKDRNEQPAQVELRFKLDNGGTAFFGFNRQYAGVTYAIVYVDDGVVFENFAQFLATFKVVNKDMAVSQIECTAASGSKSELSDKSGFPLTIAAGKAGTYYSFDLIWTGDTVKVTYDLNLPTGAKYYGGTDPSTLFKGNGKYADNNLVRGSTVARPATDDFNKYNGLYFAGWYLPKFNEQGGVDKDANGQVALDRMWDFGKALDADVTLYAKWVIHYYSYVIYPMGGAFKQDIAPSKHTDGKTEITSENYASLGYTLLSSSTRFTNANTLMRVSFEGFVYGTAYNKYVAEVTVDAAGTKVMLSFADIYAAQNRVFSKNDACLDFGGLYGDHTCAPNAKHNVESSTVDADRVGYIGWQVKEGGLNSYLTDVLFEMSVKADGSVRIDSTKDGSVNVVKIPATVDLGDGTSRPITEIGPRAMSNIKSLRAVDASEAVNLTTIGREAFAFDSNLTTFTQPDGEKVQNNISIVGKDAFANTAYEERYTSISGLDFIIINKVIYKYTGTPDENGVIDLSVENYYTAADFEGLSGVDPQEAAAGANAQLKAATHIMGGAFENVKGLKEVHLDEVFTYIEAGAFEDCEELAKLTVPEANSLQYISESAFEGCELFLSAEGGNYNSAAGAILIGNVYYYQLDRSKMALTVPDGYTLDEKTYPIKYIAAHAFNGYSRLASVTFEKEDNITYIGADAFKGTDYAESEVGGVVVNGILAEFYGPTLTSYTVPSDVHTIAEDAFGDGAGNLKVIEIPKEVETLAQYAFMGADSLEGIIFLGIEVTDGILVGAPAIDVNTFANEDGVINSDLKLYFNKSVMELFASYVDKDASKIEDERTRTWVEQYDLGSDRFVTEEISSVRLRKEKIKTVFIDSDPDADITAERALAQFKAHLSEIGEGDLIEVIRTAGESTITPLIPEKLSFEKVEGSSDADGVQFVLKYDYDVNYPDIFMKGEDQIVLDFYKAANGGRAFYSEPDPSTVYPYASNKNGNMWFEGLAGNANLPGQSIPTFFTYTDKDTLLKGTTGEGATQNNGVRFGYKDVKGTVHYISVDNIRIEGLDFDVETQIGLAYITVDFHGAGNYRFRYNYQVRNAKYVSVQQISAITVPLNADAASIIRAADVTFTGEDGKTVQMGVAGNFTLEAEEMNSDKLGQNTVHATFDRRDECANATIGLSLELLYTVVLEANPADFTYDIISEPSGEETHGTAKITGYINRNADSVATIVIPETYKVGDKVYDVVQLGELSTSNSAIGGLFANCDNLQTVYLSPNIKTIGARVFEGCMRLNSVRTAQESSVARAAELKKDDNFKVLMDGEEERTTKETRNGVEVLIKYVALDSLGGVSYDDSNEGFRGLYIQAEYNFNETEDGMPVYYRISEVNSALTLPAKGDLPIYIYFPSTIYTRIELRDESGTVTDGKDSYNIIFYENGKGRFVVYDRLNSALGYIGNNAFRGCTSLKFNKESFSECTQLSFLGVGVFTGSGIESIDLSKTAITEVNANLFEGCSQLTTVKLPTGKVTDILNGAFMECRMLSTLEGIESVKTIWENAFASCLSLKSYALTQDMTVKNYAFGNCRALTLTCNFASTAAPSGWGTHWNSYGCPVIYNDKDEMDANGYAYVEQGGVRYRVSPNSEIKVATVIAQAYDIVTADIPKTITYKSVKYTVTEIAESAFDDCAMLTSVKVSYALTTIGKYAFRNCVALSSFTFDGAGDDASDQNVGDNGLTSIGQDAFTGCNSLLTRPAVATEFEKGNFKYRLDRSNNTVTVLGFATTATAATDITIANNVTYAGVEYNIVAIGNGAFLGSNVEKVTLGANVATIGEEAFFGCTNLTTVTATTALVSIQKAAFKGCTSLSEFTGVDSSKLNCADDAFEGCTAEGFTPPGTVQP